ncbi:MAG: LysM peptidoglycan-binding domain-containing protein [Roseiflexaceae bacterium]
MLHRNALIAICAIFCVVAVSAGLFIANMSRQSGLIAQQPGTVATSLPTAVAGTEPTPLADLPTIASEPAPTTAPIAVLDPAEPTATSQPEPTSEIPTPALSGIEGQAGTPSATAEPISEPATYIEYTVQKGDLLNSIAKKYNVTAKDILAINQISNADSLTVGQVLRIPKVSG